MTIRDIISAIEDIAPLSLQEGYDNCGLQVGCADAEATGALLCVDATEEIVDEAIAKGRNLIISHHPLLFSGLKHITGSSETEAIVVKAIKHDIAIYSSHTCMDNAHGGVSWRMAQKLGLDNARTLDARPDSPTEGGGVIGELRQAMPAEDFLRLAKATFGLEAVRYSGSLSGTVKTVAMCGGSGSFLIAKAKAAGADAYLTGDIKYHDLQANRHFLIADIGHFESEQFTKEIFFEAIRKKMPTFAVDFAISDINRVKWIL